jgi:phosphopantetheinyl transferase (holo-ACP synthase)
MKVRIELEKGETREDAKEALLKALNSQRNGSAHGDQFPDPAMEYMANKLKKRYNEIWTEMLQEINEELDKV